MLTYVYFCSQGSGVFQRTRNLYSISQECNTDPVALVVEDGFWSTDGFSTATQVKLARLCLWRSRFIFYIQGAYQFQLNVPRTTITPLSSDFAAYLNSYCACKGTWVTGEARTLTFCATCSVRFLSMVDPGVTGYGTIRSYTEELRYVNARCLFDRDVNISM